MNITVSVSVPVISVCDAPGQSGVVESVEVEAQLGLSPSGESQSSPAL